MHIQHPLQQRTALGDFLAERKIRRAVAADVANGYAHLRAQFIRRTGYAPDFDAPKTFNEKIQWRKIHDRNPLFPIVSDKVMLRDYIAGKIGAAEAEALFPKLLLATSDPTRIDLKALPASYVVKANHASGWNIFVQNGNVDAARLRQECTGWLRKSYGALKHEHAYQLIKRQIVIEEFIEGPNGAAPDDLKFYLFNGKLGFAVLDEDRFGDYTQHFIDRDWHHIDMVVKKELTRRALPPKPWCFERALALAEQLGGGFDAVRVDFLFTATGLWLNEFTLYRDSGMKPFDPPEYDRIFGDMWTLPDRG